MIPAPPAEPHAQRDTPARTPPPTTEPSYYADPAAVACLEFAGYYRVADSGACTPTIPVVAAAQPKPPPATPRTYAVQFWQTIPLPAPKPNIPPGYALAGKTAYLVTDGQTHPPTYTENTPLGPLTVTAAGSYEVDWGDGTVPTWTGPYDMEGRPYPNGQITHTYDDAGTYTVTVQENWTATWALAGQTGGLTGLRTTGAIPGFEVEQAQAIITN